MTDSNNQIALPQDTQIVRSEYDSSVLAEVTTNSNWLPRLQVMGSNNELVKQGKCELGIFALINGDKLTKLPAEIDAYVISWRPLALRIKDGTPLSYFDAKSETFQEVKRIADSGAKDTGCMYGPQFLLWIPSQRTFATFFASGISARREAPNVLEIIRNEKPDGSIEYKPAMATLKIIFIPRNEKRKYSWHTFSCSKCSTPPSELPDQEVVLDELKKFNNPVDSKIEVAQQPQGDEQRAR